VLDGGTPITCRPADNIAPEIDALTQELKTLASEKSIRLAEAVIDDVLTYALFPQIGLKFLQNRDNPDAFEATPGAVFDKPAPQTPAQPPKAQVAGHSTYDVRVDGKLFEVEVAPSGELKHISQRNASSPAETAQSTPSDNEGATINAPLSGNVFKVLVTEGDAVKDGDVIIILEAMKMETEVRSTSSGRVTKVITKEGDSVSSGEPLLTLS
jgi:oxaloacetate decarboxylase alpha subunit